MASGLSNNFVATSIPMLYLDAASADVYFKFPNDGEAMVPAHKAILGIDNSVFKAMFFGPMKEANAVEIFDVSASAFKEFLQFFYLASITLTMENIEEVVRLADKYDMPKCIDSCATFLRDQLTEENMIDGYQLAMLMNHQSLIELCEEKIEMFTKDDLKSDTFLRCGKAVLERILKFDRLNCKEFDLFIACMEWAKVSCRVNGLDENRSADLKDQLGDCLYLIRFETMEMNEIVMILANQQQRHLFSKDELAEFICMKMDVNFESVTFMQTLRSKRAWVWNREVALTCELDRYETISRVKIQKSLWFSTNVLIMLGGIKTAQMTIIPRSTNVSPEMSIVEHNKLNFPLADAFSVIYVDAVNLKNGVINLIKLPRPIAIQPNKMYEIRFEVPENSRICHFAYGNKMEYKLNEEITIKFNQNPHEEENSGLVAKLYFNPI